ncbi:MAG TPA: hypothetical protein VFJ77_00375 [Gaiellaceae bacterium]|nr:hypothetical protein [Gaiellaceae bacterium]
MTDTRRQHQSEVECPHCHKRFLPEPLPVGRAARYHGYKCPHCNLFVPAARAAEHEPLSRDPDG